MLYGFGFALKIQFITFFLEFPNLVIATDKSVQYQFSNNASPSTTHCPTRTRPRIRSTLPWYHFTPHKSVRKWCFSIIMRIDVCRKLLAWVPSFMFVQQWNVLPAKDEVAECDWSWIAGFYCTWGDLA